MYNLSAGMSKTKRENLQFVELYVHQQLKALGCFPVKILSKLYCNAASHLIELIFRSWPNHTSPSVSIWRANPVVSDLEGFLRLKKERRAVVLPLLLGSQLTAPPPTVERPLLKGRLVRSMPDPAPRCTNASSTLHATIDKFCITTEQGFKIKLVLRLLGTFIS